MSAEEHISVRTYAIIFVSLLVLLFISVGVSFIPTGEHHALRDLLTLVGFTIAGAKAVMIILWFMHVKISSRLTWVFAAAGFVWLALFVVGTLGDYATRPDALRSSTPQITESSAHAEEYRPEDSTGHYVPK